MKDSELEKRIAPKCRYCKEKMIIGWKHRYSNGLLKIQWECKTHTYHILKEYKNWELV